MVNYTVLIFNFMIPGVKLDLPSWLMKGVMVDFYNNSPQWITSQQGFTKHLHSLFSLHSSCAWSCDYFGQRIISKDNVIKSLWLIHVEVWQKTAKFGKAIILQ